MVGLGRPTLHLMEITQPASHHPCVAAPNVSPRVFLYSCWPHVELSAGSDILRAPHGTLWFPAHALLDAPHMCAVRHERCVTLEVLPTTVHSRQYVHRCVYSRAFRQSNAIVDTERRCDVLSPWTIVLWGRALYILWMPPSELDMTQDHVNFPRCSFAAP